MSVAASTGSSRTAGCTSTPRPLSAHATGRLASDPLLRARSTPDSKAATGSAGRSCSARLLGQAPPGYSAVTKTWCTEFEQRVADFCVSIAGPDVMIWGRTANICYVHRDTPSWVGPRRSCATSSANGSSACPADGARRHIVRGTHASSFQDLPALRGHLRSRDHNRRRRCDHPNPRATVTTCSRRGSSARRDPRSSSSTAIPTACALRSSSATGSSSRPLWAEAFDVVADGLGRIWADGERDAVALYLGNPNAHTLAGTLFGGQLVKAFGSKNLYSASTVDQMPKHVSSGYLFGNAGAIPAPGPPHRLPPHAGCEPLRVQRQPGAPCRLPWAHGRHSRSAAAVSSSSIHAGPRAPTPPTSTSPSVRAPTHCGWRCSSTRSGLPVSSTWERRPTISMASTECSPLSSRSPPRRWPPTRVCRQRRPAESLGSSPRPRRPSATDGSVPTPPSSERWRPGSPMRDTVTGNLDRPGGDVPPPGARSTGEATGCRRTAAAGRSRVLHRPVARRESGGHPEVRGEMPVAVLAEEIETDGPGKVRALITSSGNPVRSCPDSERLDAALASSSSWCRSTSTSTRRPDTPT